MTLPIRYEQLDATNLQFVNRTCERFEHALANGEVVRTEEWVAEIVGPVREVLLEELLLLECEYQLRNQSKIDSVDLLRRFPDHSGLLRTTVQQAVDYALAKREMTPVEALPLPTRIGRFAIQRLLGVGGFGNVYLAVDLELHREVALKVAHPHAAMDSQDTSRLGWEAKRLAKLNHPNLVSVFDTGVAEGRQYLVSEYVDGPNLAEWLRQRKIEGQPVPPQLATLMLQNLAEAADYIHRQGILHCDIKPANILLDRANPPVPRLADFGLSRLLDGTAAWSITGRIIGTPQYMAPEQANGNVGEVSVTSDVYSLGAVLYELLTGRPAVENGTVVEVLRRVAEEVPNRPRRFRPQLPTDLEAICLKCLEKQPNLRYQTARELADDLTRFLDGLPVEAALPSHWRRFTASVRRHPLLSSLVLLSSLMILSILLGLVVHTKKLDTLNQDLLHAQANLVREQETRVQQETAIRAKAYPDQIRAAGLAIARWDRGTAQRILDGIQGGSPFGNDRSFEWRHLRARATDPPEKILAAVGTPIYTLDASPDRRLVAFGGEDRTVRVIDVKTGDLVAGPWVHPAPIGHLAFSPDGHQIAVASADHVVRIWTIGQNHARVVGSFPGKPHHVMFHPTANMLAIGGDDPAIVVFDLTSTSGQPRTLRQPAFRVRSMEFSHEGDRIVFGTKDHGVQMWKYATHDVAEAVPNRESHINTLRLTPDGRELLVGARSSAGVTITSMSGMGVNQQTTRLTDGINADERINDFAWSRTGRKLAVARESGVDVWDWPTRVKLLTLSAWDSRIYGLRFVGDDDQLVRVAADGTVRTNRFMADSGISRATIPWGVRSIAFTPDGKQLALAHQGQFQTIHQIATDQMDTGAKALVPKFSGISLGVVAFHGTTVGLMALQKDDRLHLYRTEQTRIIRPKLERFEELKRGHSDWLYTACNSTGETFCAANSEAIRVWDAQTGKLKHQFSEPINSIRAIAIFGDTLFATGCWDATIRLRTLGVQASEKTLTGHSRSVRGLVFTHDGTRLISCGWDRTIRLWSLTEGRCLQVFRAHGGIVHTIAVSPDDRTVASGGDDGVLRLWHVESGLELFSMSTNGPIYAVAFDPTGSRLAVASDVGQSTQLQILNAP